LLDESKKRMVRMLKSSISGVPDHGHMGKGKLLISIDLEAAWGVWDVLTPDHLRMAETAERPICAALIELFDRHQVPATWAVVAALLDERSAASRPGSKACWFAPDIIASIVNARAAHEVGSHSGKHIYFDRATSAQAREDLDFARSIHRANGLPFRSFIFPRNAVAHLDVLADIGLRTFRGNDVDWTAAARRVEPRLGQAANLIDKLLPIPPSPVFIKTSGALTDVPASMLLMGRNGLRRLVLPAVTRRKLRMGLERAKRRAQLFHLWFHPSNFYYRREEQLATLSWFLEYAADQAGRGEIEISTMGSHAQ
jgi:peptidoglycan/xylan/chitin deacetylase (PgdA/CDA1 family)